jgi:hypothetical protein
MQPSTPLGPDQVNVLLLMYSQEIPDTSAYTPEMVGPDGKKLMGPDRVTPEQVATQKALEQAKKT